MKDWKDPMVETPNKNCIVDIKFFIREIDDEVELETKAFFNIESQSFSFDIGYNPGGLERAIKHVRLNNNTKESKKELKKLSLEESFETLITLGRKKISYKEFKLKQLREIDKRQSKEFGGEICLYKEDGFKSRENLSNSRLQRQDITLEKWAINETQEKK